LITLAQGPCTLINGKPEAGAAAGASRDATAAYKILNSHDRGGGRGFSQPGGRGEMRIKFDALISHDITYVGIIQTARASGMTRFPVPYILTNCHNSLCAVGGTINADDHAFGLSAAKKYGGAFVPANQSVIHQYAREAVAESGAMILGSDSHTRYGALGAMGIGEGGPELVKQLLGNTYDVPAPEVVLVWLENAPPRGTGPHDIAIALCGAVYGNNFVKNKVLEFAGPGLSALPMDYRFGIDVMTTETACLTSIWRADDKEVAGYYERHGRPGAYKPLAQGDGALYDAMIRIDLSSAEPMIAAPFHPSRAFTIKEFNAAPADILREAEREAAGQFGGKTSFSLTDKVKDGRLIADQGIIAGCAGGMYDNIREAAAIFCGDLTDTSARTAGPDMTDCRARVAISPAAGGGAFSLSVYPSSMPVNLQLIESGVQRSLIRAGAVFKPCFCGPCFGAGDVPANNGFSLRHTTRNFINREGSKPGDGQLAAVALMDARSIAATARNGGAVTSAAELEYAAPGVGEAPAFDGEIYKNRVYNGYGRPEPDAGLVFGPNIADWPRFEPLGEHLLLRLAGVIFDPVTTTDELIPSGEASSYRSNPVKLASFTLSRRDPQYVGRAQATRSLGEAHRRGERPGEALAAITAAAEFLGEQIEPGAVQISSAIFAKKPGDGSAREQAASCQRVLGGGANICYEYATKRYRSNLINWGMLPFLTDAEPEFDGAPGDWVFVWGARVSLTGGGGPSGRIRFDALLLNAGGARSLTLYSEALTEDERAIILSGCLMNYYAEKNKNAG